MFGADQLQTGTPFVQPATSSPKHLRSVGHEIEHKKKAAETPTEPRAILLLLSIYVVLCWPMSLRLSWYRPGEDFWKIAIHQVDTLKITDDDAAFILGKGGKTKEK